MQYPADFIESVSLSRVDVPLRDDFVIARGRVQSVQNLFVKIQTKNGLVGYGEVTPFPELDGDDRASNERAIEKIAKLIIGQNIGSIEKTSRIMRESFPTAVATRCGLELALIDIHAKLFRVPLHDLFGGASQGPLQTDITIPILPFERCMELAKLWYDRGFRVFKIKIGKDTQEDLEKITAISKLQSDTTFILDANQGYDLDQALYLIDKLKFMHHRIIAYEQPLSKYALAEMAELQKAISIPVVADEAVTTLDDLFKVIRLQSAKWINIKIMKSGILEALQIAKVARRSGIGLMIGGMIETRMSVGCSLAVALGLGNFKILDLDSPLLMHDDPIEGGFKYEGPLMYPSMEPGLGMQPWGIQIWEMK